MVWRLSIFLNFSLLLGSLTQADLLPVYVTTCISTLQWPDGLQEAWFSSREIRGSFVPRGNSFDDFLSVSDFCFHIRHCLCLLFVVDHLICFVFFRIYVLPSPQVSRTHCTTACIRFQDTPGFLFGVPADVLWRFTTGCLGTAGMDWSKSSKIPLSFERLIVIPHRPHFPSHRCCRFGWLGRGEKDGWI
jgi:hypothetical protein